MPTSLSIPPIARTTPGSRQLAVDRINYILQNLEAAAKLKPNQAHVHYQLGRAYIAAGRKKEGEDQLEISRELKEKARAKGN